MVRSTQIYPNPIVTVDPVIFALIAARLTVLLMRRATDPFDGQWALPGGYIHADEDADLDAAARRILREKTNVETPYLEQLQGFGGACRDPRGWAVTYAYFALIRPEDAILKQGRNAGELAWHPITGDDTGQALAFDHADILRTAVQRLRSKVSYSLLPVHLLPAKFTLPDLQKLYEQLLGRTLEKAAFRKRMAEMDFLVQVEGEKRHASNRPAQLYRIDPVRAAHYMDRTL